MLTVGESMGPENSASHESAMLLSIPSVLDVGTLLQLAPDGRRVEEMRVAHE
jgi:hypothetical protein